jgi:hypothetical protein
VNRIGRSRVLITVAGHSASGKEDNNVNRLQNTAALAALVTGILMAQPPNPPDPATMIQHRVTRLTALLNLTTSQVAEATTIFTNAQTALTPIQTSLSGYRTALQTAVKSNATASIDQIAASIGTATGQVTAIQNKAEAAFYATLTVAQQTTLNAAGGGFGGGRGPGGPGGPGGFGRGPARQ